MPITPRSDARSSNLPLRGILVTTMVSCAALPVIAIAAAATSAPQRAQDAVQQSAQISAYVREVYQDRAGTLWFGTNGDGLARYDGEKLTYLSTEDGLAGVAIRGILQAPAPDDSLWFATNNGVSRYDANGTFTNYTTDDGLSHNSIWSIAQDSAGLIWVGTHAGVCRFDGASFKPFALPADVAIDTPDSRFSPEVVFAMVQDTAGNRWFGTDGHGVHRYDGASFTSYTTSDGLAGNVVRALREDHHGNIWIGTNGGGVSRFDGETFHNFTIDDGLNNNRIYEIYEDQSHNLWFSTLGAGVSRYDGNAFTSFGVEHKLVNLHPRSEPGNIHVQEFFQDRDGILWLGCSGGLFRFDAASTTFINITRDGPWPQRTPDPQD